MRIEKKEAIVVDIDGTIADNSHRTHLVEGRKKNWKKFFEKMVDDKPIQQNILLVHKYFKGGHIVIIFTGRYEKDESLTRNWLDKYLGIKEYLLFQRDNNDFRDSKDYKKETLLKIQENFNIRAIMENDKKIIELCKRMNLTYLEV